MDLTYASVKVGGKSVLNHSKISKEDAFNIIKDNSLQIVEESSEIQFGDKYSFPYNFDVIKNLLEHECVYATPNINFNHFDGEKFIGEFMVHTLKSSEMTGIVKDIVKYLSRGLNVYIHSYYVMEVDRYIDNELTIHEPWFWYKIGITKK